MKNDIEISFKINKNILILYVSSLVAMIAMVYGAYSSYQFGKKRCFEFQEASGIIAEFDISGCSVQIEGKRYILKVKKIVH